MSLTSCLNSSLPDGLRLARADFDEHADFRAGVDVAGNQPVAVHFHARVPGDFDVLADFGDERRAVGLQVRLGIRGEPFRHVVAKGAERFVARDEIRLAVHLDEHAELSAGRDVLGDGAFPGLARGLHGGGGLAFFAENVHGGVEVAFRFHERAFAIHHARAGHLAEFVHVSSSNLSHTNW